MIRAIRLTDISALGGRQHVAPLDLPDGHVLRFSPRLFGARAALGPLRSGAEGLLLTSGHAPRAACYYDAPRRGEHARILALATFDGDAPALGRLVERVCLRAAGDGKMRVLARPEDGGELAGLFHALGFTVATRETVYARAVGETPHAPDPEPLRRDDVWDAWKLYNATEPVPLRHAEGLTPLSWQRERRARRGARQGWVVRAEGNVIAHHELLIGEREAALGVYFDPAHRALLPGVVDHALATCARLGKEQLYCTVREHQAELDGLLLARGFEAVRRQVRLVLYTSVFSYAPEVVQSAALGRAAALLRAGVSGLSGSSAGREASRWTEWYTSEE